MGIVGREIYDNLNSLRFAFATVLIVALLVTNAIVYLRAQPMRVQAYQRAAADAKNTLAARSSSLYRLATEGPGTLRKAPAPLRFCAEGDETYLPNYASGSNHFPDIAGTRPVWRLMFPQETPNLRNIRPDATAIDWSFIVSYVLSFIALLFTFDSIAGERERGTLRLIAATPTPRWTVLVGKFFGTFISINIPFTGAVLLNLALIATADTVHLDTDAWLRIGLLYGIGMLYISIFIALGLLVSAAVRERSVSLVLLLLIWVSLVVFLPNTLASIGSRASVPIPYTTFWNQRIQIGKDVRTDYDSRYKDSETPVPRHVRAEYLNTEAERYERFNVNYLHQQIAQGEQARAHIRLSPAALLQQLYQTCAGTGFQRHRQFLENVQRYAREYREFIVDTDSTDPESQHIIGIREGMSTKSVTPAAVPTFKDTPDLTRDLTAAATDLLLLLLFFGVLLAAAYLTFIRLEI